MKSIPEARSWFKTVDGQIRKFTPGDQGGFNRMLRDVTQEEWEQIHELVLAHEFPCRLESGPYGFFFIVHDRADISGERTAQLLVVEDPQFPFPCAKNGFAGQDETVRMIAPLTHRPRNQELLQWYGFERLMAQERYSY